MNDVRFTPVKEALQQLANEQPGCEAVVSQLIEYLRELQCKTLQEESMRQLRRKKGMTQGELAALLGCSVPFISQVEKGLKRLGVERGEKLMQIFEVDQNTPEK